MRIRTKKVVIVFISLIVFFSVIMWILNKNDGQKVDIVNNSNEGDDGVDADKSDCFIYDGKMYIGLGMSWKLTDLPPDFRFIGRFKGPLSDKNENLTSTMVFHDNEELFLYTDDKGYYYFCAKRDNNGHYIGLFMAVEYSDEISDESIEKTPHELRY